MTDENGPERQYETGVSSPAGEGVSQQQTIAPAAPAQGQGKLAQLFARHSTPWTWNHVFERAFDAANNPVELSQADVIDMANVVATLSPEHRAGLLAGTHVVVPREQLSTILDLLSVHSKVWRTPEDRWQCNICDEMWGLDDLPQHAPQCALAGHKNTTIALP